MFNNMMNYMGNYMGWGGWGGAYPFQTMWWFWLWVPLLAWSLVWKGWALWRSARLGNKPWFVVLLIVNTLGILDILYIFVFSKKASKVRGENV